MHADYPQMMLEATRLTRTGDLTGATALLQQALQGGAGSGVEWKSPAFHDAALRRAPAIDVIARTVPEPGAAAAPAATPQATATGAEAFSAGSYAHPSAGQRSYKLYVPPAAGSKPLPLVVMLHGCTQDPDDFARGTAMNQAAREQGVFVLYPAQSADMNPQRCWNWFKHNHQQRGRGEPALLAGMVQRVLAEHRIDPARVYVAGLSAGGAMAAILGETYPDVFAAVGVHSGLAAGSASDLPSAFAAMQGAGASGAGAAAAAGSGMPTIVFHGDADHTVNVGNAQQVIAASVGAATALEAAEASADGRRRMTRRVHRDASGRTVAELWTVHGAPHAWAGGDPAGSFTDRSGPDATREMLRFFAGHELPAAR